MEKKFNTRGLCVPSKHYMVDISDKLVQIKTLIDAEEYFTINRGRQYGKTTTISHLRRFLLPEYTVVSISFEGFSNAILSSEKLFCQEFLNRCVNYLEKSGASSEICSAWKNNHVNNFSTLDGHITNVCRESSVVLMIDEVDKANNYHVFLDFLNMLCSKYLERADGMDFTFHSVILAGVYDIRNIKLKMIDDGYYKPEGEERKVGSPWNIAVNFDVDMSFSPNEIKTMLDDYEKDHQTGMELTEISEEIYDYTSGYPFLVSRICQCVHEKLDKNWTRKGIQKAIKIILTEKNMLFDDLIKNLVNDSDLSDFIYQLLIKGRTYSYNVYHHLIEKGVQYGYFKDVEGRVKIANKIFEIQLLEYFIALDETAKKEEKTNVVQKDVVQNGRFNMELCLEKFTLHYGEIFTQKDIKFLEKHGRLIFLTYIRPLINGQGFYHIESQTTDERQMDLIIDFGTDQFILELKIWRGEQYQQEAYEQLAGYLEQKNAKKGYLLTFDFRSMKKEKKIGWITVGDKEIFEVQV